MLVKIGHKRNDIHKSLVMYPTTLSQQCYYYHQQKKECLSSFTIVCNLLVFNCDSAASAINYKPRSKACVLVLDARPAASILKTMFVSVAIALTDTAIGDAIAVALIDWRFCKSCQTLLRRKLPTLIQRMAY